MPNTITHFEVPADDPERAKKFYESVFGWKIDYMKDYDYYSIVTKEKGEEGINGGMMKRKDKGQPFMNYITVSSIDRFLEAVKENGGQIAMGKQAIGDMGAIAAFLDTEGNLIGLHEMWKKSD